MTKRHVMIRIVTTRLQIAEHLFDEEMTEELDEELTPPDDEPCEPVEIWMEGRLVTNSHRVELVYEEGELSGMEGSVTSIGFERDRPGLVSMMRSGPVSTAMIFEENKRHFSVYDTPFSSFQICVRALRVENALLSAGHLALEYQIEIHGAQAEHCTMEITVSDNEALFPKA